MGLGAALVATLLPLGAASGAAAPRASATILAVGAENEYANVISQIAGSDATVVALMSNPNTDPHTFEASPAIAEEVSRASHVVQNGLGYDDFMTEIEKASPDPRRKVIDVRELLHLPSSTANPHLWYAPTTMPAVARAIASDLAELEPQHAATFRENADRFIASLSPWLAEISRIKRAFPGARAAVTEPVWDYLLQAAGADIATPFALQADIMNGIDPSPQAVA